MAKRKAGDVLSDYTNAFIGGMNTSLNSEDLSPNTITLGRNLLLNDFSAAKRHGVTKVNGAELATSERVRSLYIGNGSGSVKNKIIAISDSKIYSMTTAGAVTERATGLNTSQRWDFCEGVLSGTSRIIMVAKNNAPYQWDGLAGSATTFTGPATNGDYCMYHLGKLWIADEDLRLIYVSEHDLISTWHALDQIRVGRESDGPITRIVSMGRYFVCFMQNAVYLISGNRVRSPRNMSIEQVDLNDGCPAPWSVTRINNKIFWVGNDGFYVLIGREARRLTTSIQAEFDAIDRDTIDESQGGRLDDVWMVSVPHNASATNTRTYFIHWTLPVNEFGEYPITYGDGEIIGASYAYSPGLKRTYIGDDVDGFVHKYDTATFADNGAAVPYELITRGLHFGDQYTEKVFTKIQPQFDVVAGGTVVVSARTNDSVTDVECPTATTGAPFSLGATGDFMGQGGGDPDYARNGVVHTTFVPSVDGEPLTGTWFKARFYDSSTKNLVLRRAYYESIYKAR